MMDQTNALAELTHKRRLLFRPMVVAQRLQNMYIRGIHATAVEFVPLRHRKENGLVNQ
jgi:DNA-directed RNA polymerase beta subunit